MRLNEHQRKFAFPLFILIFILVFSIIRHGVSFERALTVFGIIISFFIPYLLLSHKIFQSRVWYRSAYLHIANLIFLIDWVFCCFFFYRENDSITFMNFYRPHFVEPNGFTAVMFFGMLYCLFMSNLIIKNLHKKSNENNMKIE